MRYILPLAESTYGNMKLTRSAPGLPGGWLRQAERSQAPSMQVPLGWMCANASSYTAIAEYSNASQYIIYVITIENNIIFRSGYLQARLAWR